MNHINQRNKLDIQISSYVGFLKIATRSQSIKLCREIIKLSDRIAIIDDMGYLDQRKEVAFSEETKQSKMNLKVIPNNNKEYLQMSNRKRNSPENCKPIFGEAAELRRKALQLASEHVDVKPVKYLLKR